jgi:hypothetical protein
MGNHALTLAFCGKTKRRPQKFHIFPFGDPIKILLRTVEFGGCRTKHDNRNGADLFAFLLTFHRLAA